MPKRLFEWLSLHAIKSANSVAATGFPSFRANASIVSENNFQTILINRLHNNPLTFSFL